MVYRICKVDFLTIPIKSRWREFQQKYNFLTNFQIINYLHRELWSWAYICGSSARWRETAGCWFRTEIPAVCGATCVLCATSEQHFWWPIIRCRRSAYMEWAAVQSTRHTGLSLTTFNEHLKTYLFSTAFWDHGAFVTFMISLRRI